MLGSFGEYQDVFTNSFSASSRRRSIVSFNLNNPERGDDDDNVFGDRSTADSPHMRTIGDTFNAWQESFKRADSRLSLFSYTGDSTLKTPDTMGDSDSDTSSILSDKVQNPRPKSSFSNNSVPRRGSGKVTWEKGLYCEDETPKSSDSGESQPELELTKNSKDDKVSDIKDASHNEEEEMKVKERENFEQEKSLNKETLDNVHDTKSTENERNNLVMIQSTDDKDNNCTGGSEGVSENAAKMDLEFASEDQLSEKQLTSADEVENTVSSQIVASMDENAFMQQSSSNSEIELSKGNTPKNQIGPASACEDVKDEQELIGNHIQGNEDSYEENAIVGGKFQRTLKSNPSTTSLSEISSEVSIPIIVSDESSERISDEKSIANDVQSTDEEFEKDKRTFKGIDIDEMETRKAVEDYVISYEDDASVQVNSNEERMEDRTEKNYDYAEIKQPNEIGNDEENQERKLSRLVTPDEEETGDLAFDFETNSEYTLKGIRGILRRRVSTAATSVGFDFDQSDISDDDDYLEDEKPYDLATKEGLDEFKMFLLGTVAEKYLRFWVDVECLRHEKNKDR